MRKKKDNKSAQSASGQQSPLALLAATCSKLEETGDGAGGKNVANNVQQTLKVINSSGMINANDLAQYMQFAGPGQTVGIVNADGTITQITGSPMATSSSATSMKPVTSIASQSQITQLAQAGQLSSGGVAYSIIPAQQVQSVQIDGQEALYIPAGSFGGAAGQQTFQIAGTNQIFTQQAAASQPTQTVVRTSTGTGQSTSTTQQTAVIQGVQGLNNMTQLTQLAGGQVALTRPGNVMQTLQLPVNSLQQTIQVQVPIQTQNGQTLYQMMQLPISALSGLTGGQQVVQQMPQQIQMAQIQLPTTGGTGKDGDGQTGGQSQVNSSAAQGNQNVIAINLPNGQLGQLISAPQWGANALNLSNLTG